MFDSLVETSFLAAPPSRMGAAEADRAGGESTARVYRVEVASRQAALDQAARRAAERLRVLGVSGGLALRSLKVYAFSGCFGHAEAERFSRDMLCDPVAEMFAVNRPVLSSTGMIEVEAAARWDACIPDDPVARQAARLMGLELLWFRPARRWLVSGFSGEPRELEALLSRALFNPAVEDISVGRPLDLKPPVPVERLRGRVERLLRDCDDDGLRRLSREGRLGLDLDAMRALQAHYLGLGREPTDIELDTYAVCWSEHCSRKTLRGAVRYIEDGRAEEVFERLYDETLGHAARVLDCPWCLSATGDGAGVVDFDGEYALAVKTQTRNRPSAVDPRSGAATALGTAVRQTLAVGCGAEPVFGFAAACLGDPYASGTWQPPGVMTPRRLFAEACEGLFEYARHIGVPIGSRRLETEPRYATNPLIIAGMVSLAPRAGLIEPPEIEAGMFGLVLGARTGREGAHGAQMASSPTSAEINKAVAGAAPSWSAGETEKLIRVVMRGREEGLWRRIVNVGGGGLAAAFSALAAGVGARVDLDRLPARHAGLSPLDLWIGESEERMAAVALRKDWPRIREIAVEEEVEIAQVAAFTDDGALTLHWHDEEIGRIDPGTLRRGQPPRERAALWATPPRKTVEPVQRDRYDDDLRALLRQWSLCSRVQEMRHADSIMRGAGMVGPLVGQRLDMLADACVFAPRFESRRAVSVSMGLCPGYSDLDPYAMAANAIDQALCRGVAAGADPSRCALLYNLCWGDTSSPEALGRMVRTLKACRDASLAFGTPFIAGRDSLNNEFAEFPRTYSIPDTLLVTAVAPLDDLALAITPDVKAAGDPLYLVGLTRRELGGSLHYALRGETGGMPPSVDAVPARRAYQAFLSAARAGGVRAAIACGSGGLAAAAACMLLSADLGAEIDLERVPAAADARDDMEALLFSESASRLLVEVERGREDSFTQCMEASGAAVRAVGVVATLPRLAIRCRKTHRIDSDLEELRSFWRAPLHGL